MLDAVDPVGAELDDVRTAVADIEGWLSDDQVERLHHAARRLPAGGRIVEIGSFRGRSTVVLALSAPQAGELVAIDPHAGNDRGPQEYQGYEDAAAQDHEVFLSNLEAAAVRDRVRHVRQLSSEALGEVAGDVDLLYIDGAHRYAPARDDLVAWGRRVPDGGTLVIHDAFSSVGVTLALVRTMFASPRFAYVGRSGSLAEYAAGRLTGAQRVRSGVQQAAQLPWFVRNLAVKLLLLLRLGRVARLLGSDGETWPY